MISCNQAFANLLGGTKPADIAHFSDFYASDTKATVDVPALLEGLVRPQPDRLTLKAGEGKTFAAFVRAVPAGEHFILYVDDVASRQNQKDFLQLLIRLATDPDMAFADMSVKALRSFCNNFDFTSAALIYTAGERAESLASWPEKAGGRFCFNWVKVHEPRLSKLGAAASQRDVPPRSCQSGRMVYLPLFAAREQWGYLVLEGRTVAIVRRALGQETFLRSIIMWLSGRLSEHVTRTDLMSLNAAMQESEERFRSLYRGTPAMLHTINEEKQLVEVSDKWLETLGYTREEVIGRPSMSFLSPISQTYASRVFPDFLRNGWVANIPYTVLRKDGTPLEVELSAVRCPGPAGEMQSLAVMVDVTERNRAFREIEEKRESLKKANNSLRKFTYIASHDFQEPLRKMQQFSYLLRQECEDQLTEEGLEYLQVIAASAQRMSTLIGDLLLYSRISNSLPELTEVDLADALRAALESEQRHLNHDIPIDLHSDILPVIYADRLQAQRLLRALVSNAIKFRHPRRSLSISVSFGHAPSGDGFMLRFADNGLGFENRYEDKIFEPLQKLHPGQLYPGTGMGLAIARAICDNHNWKISGEGTLNEGACFNLILPQTALADIG